MDRKPHHVMTTDEYSAMQIKGWHEVCRDVDGFGGVGVRFIPEIIVAAPDAGWASYAGRMKGENEILRLQNSRLQAALDAALKISV